jgi:chromosome segregation ATPase
MFFAEVTQGEFWGGVGALIGSVAAAAVLVWGAVSLAARQKKKEEADIASQQKRENADLARQERADALKEWQEYAERADKENAELREELRKERAERQGEAKKSQEEITTLRKHLHDLRDQHHKDMMVLWSEHKKEMVATMERCSQLEKKNAELEGEIKLLKSRLPPTDQQVSLAPGDSVAVTAEKSK